jgi:predicted nicotinamide N-methyase
MLNRSSHRYYWSYSNLQVQIDYVSDFDALFDEFLEQGDEHPDLQDERIPYWADLWPAALGLASYLVRTSAVSQGMRVCETGCGMALPGIVCGALGAEVVLSDYLPEALRWAAHNWALNLKQPLQTALMDWRNPDPALRADLLLGADIAYEERAQAWLPDVFRTLIGPGGRALISEQGRPVALSFFERLPTLGFEVGMATEAIHYRNQVWNIRIYEVRVKQT